MLKLFISLHNIEAFSLKPKFKPILKFSFEISVNCSFRNIKV